MNNNLYGLLSGAQQFGNPMLDIGMGLLSVAGPSPQPQSIGQGIMAGLQHGQQRQQLALQNEMVRARLDEMAASRQAGSAIQELIGSLASPDDPAAMISSDQARVLAQLAAVNPSAALDRTLGLLGPVEPEKPTTLEREYQFLTSLGVDGETALGALRRGTVVNVGGEPEKPLSVSDLQSIRLPDGSTLPVGTTPSEARAAGAVVVTEAERQQFAAAEGALALLDQFEAMAVGPDGVFSEIEPGFLNRAGTAVGFALDELTREDGRAGLFRDLSQGSVATLIRTLGEKGAMSDGDVSRALALIPNISGRFGLPDTANEARQKLTTLRSLLERGLSRLQEQDAQPAQGNRVFDFDPASGSLIEVSP